ncbi:MAG: MBL fold metallo-hydrolase [Dehalococcoidia bacterium]
MDITWLGRRCFGIRSRDAVVVTDPHAEAISRLPKEQILKAITISRSDLATDLPERDRESGYPRIIKGPGEYEVADILITGVATLLESQNEQGQTDRGKNTIYAIELEGLVTCHLGELQRPLTSEQTEEMSAVSVLLVPVGDPQSFQASMDTISLLEPKLVIPMGYQTDAAESDTSRGEVSSQALNRFLKEMGVKEVEPQRRLRVTTSTLPQQTQVAVLEIQG